MTIKRAQEQEGGAWSSPQRTIWVEDAVPDIKLDLSSVTYSSVLEIIAPIVPGGILAVGTLVLNPSLAARVLSTPFLGYRSRLVAAIFVSYTAGLLLNLLVSYTSYLVGYLVGSLFGSKLFPDPPTPWKNLPWRQLARRFLGSDLAPATDELYFKDLHEQESKKADAIQDPQERARKQKFVEDYFRPKSIADGDWFWWYQVLGKYFALSQRWAAPWQYFLSMLNTASWAVILLMVSNNRHHWFAWVLCLAGLFFGNGVSWFSGGFFSDPYATEQTAMLLRAMKARYEPDTKNEKEPPA